MRRETLDLVRDGRFVTAAGSILMLLCACLWTGAMDYATTQQRQQQTSAHEWDRWLSQGERSPHSAAHQGFWVFQPREALSFFDPGIRRYAGGAVHLEAHSQRLFRYRPAGDATSVQRAGELTAALTLQKFIPLLIVLVGFGALAAERENGILRLALSSGAPPRTLVFGKALGLAAPLVVVLAPAAIVGGLTLALYGDTPARALWLRATLLAACYFAYFAVFVAITLAVSARAATARSALTILLTFWVITVLLAPPLVLSAAARRSPTPTAVELAGNLQRARADGPLYFERLITVEDRLRQEYQVAAVEQLPVNPEGVAMFEEEADEGAVQDAHFRQLFEVYRQQNALFQLGSAISPLVAVQALSMNLSGTSLEHHLHFAEAAENYRRTFVQLMNRAIADAALPANSQSIAVQRGQDLWEATPRFVYSPPGLDTLASWSVIAIASLAAWLFAIAAFSALALRRFSRNAI